MIYSPSFLAPSFAFPPSAVFPSSAPPTSLGGLTELPVPVPAAFRTCFPRYPLKGRILLSGVCITKKKKKGQTRETRVQVRHPSRLQIPGVPGLILGVHHLALKQWEAEILTLISDGGQKVRFLGRFRVFSDGSRGHGWFFVKGGCVWLVFSRIDSLAT